MTPMMEQYWQVKRAHPDKFVLFRLGDFWELFYDDAEQVSRLLDLTLTARSNKHERIPMCGVPYHAAEPYIQRLLDLGYKLVLCDQVEPAVGQKLVRREITKILTPGTAVGDEIAGRSDHQFLAALVHQNDAWALASVDPATGTCQVTTLRGAGAFAGTATELQRLEPRECLIAEGDEAGERLLAEYAPQTVLSKQPPAHYDQHEASRLVTEQFGASVAAELAQSEHGLALIAFGVLLQYLQATQRQALRHLQTPRVYEPSEYLLIDRTARRHLQLTVGDVDGSRRGSLLAVLDQTCTAMGSRQLKTWLEQPLRSIDAINERLDAVGAFLNRPSLLEQVRARLRGVYDLQRLSAKIALKTANAKDLVALRQSLETLPALQAMQDAWPDSRLLSTLFAAIDPLPDLTSRLAAALVDDPPVALTEGGIFRNGYHPEIDRLRQAATEGKSWLAALEAQERERTGIKSLKIRFNKVFGYFIEVTHSNLHLVPPDYERKQTLANAERFVTPALKEMEATILGAEERLTQLEYEQFVRLRALCEQQLDAIQRTAQCLAQIDVLASLALVAQRNHYSRPQLTEAPVLTIKGGRHPMLERQPDVRFVPNDLSLTAEHARMAIVTGPNMGGKSTFLRQVALIVVMAQMGSYVPADEAVIGLVDRIFTRIGSADELSRGFSTFMVEIQEALSVLMSGTRHSLAIIDELGRGTSTFDGIAFSKAYLEYLHEHVGCRTLVSTHFFELTELSEKLPGVINLHVGAALHGDRLVFSHQVMPGPADRSYGIEVARMAGMPAALILQARAHLAQLEAQQKAAGTIRLPDAPPVTMMDGASPQAAAWHAEVDAFLNEVAATDILRMTPLEAMARLQQLAERATQIRTWYDHATT